MGARAVLAVLPMRPVLLGVLLLVPSLTAQDTKPEPRLRFGLAVAPGNFEVDLGLTDDDTDALFLRLQGEYISELGLGGGLRVESFVSDDDLFGTGSAGAEASNGAAFGHFTYAFGSKRFEMPLRIGALANSLTIEANSGGENEASSIGPYVEIAPELTLIHVGPTRWTIYGELGGGYTYTQIEIDGVSEEFDSTSIFLGVEVGTRLRLGMFEAGLGFLARFQDTDESDPEGGITVAAFDSTFTGVLVSAALRF